MSAAAAKPVEVTPAAAGDYFQLLKPRVMSLVVFTALTGLVAADTPMHAGLAVIAIFCVAVGAGAAGALNMAWDSDIDALMRRTRARPVPAGKVSRGDAAGLGVVLSLFSVMVMGMTANYLAAGLLAFTILFYAVIYTMWLKRSTPQNIVIGGAAGALPPVVGWAAASGTMPLNAWLMFLIIFMWTPPHFWALSLYTSGDYAKAGVPMMPVAKGAASTRKHILAYSLILAPLGLGPVFTGLGGPVYGVVSAVGGAVFVGLAWRLFRSQAGDSQVASSQAPGPDGLYAGKPGSKTARDLFAFSLFYLFALFATILGEHVFKWFVP